jgi:Ala-tRNA(Pro) deacylase
MRCPYEGIINLLHLHGVEYESIEHDPVHTCEQAAAVRGLKLEQGAKSLLFKYKADEVTFVLVVVPGHKRVNSKELKRILRVKDVRFASPEEVNEQMGCKIGSCYPFGNIAGLRTLIDESFSSNEIVSFNPGRHDVSIKMRYADYQKIAQPEIVSVTV